MSLKSTLFWAALGGGLIALLAKQGRRRTVAHPVETLPPDPEIEAALDRESLDVDSIGFEPLEIPEVRTAGRVHPDEDVAMEDGQNWLEALETDSIEDDPSPDKPLDISDDGDIDHSTLDLSGRDDVPVADRGAGGPGGI